jgi:choline-phosphate cytidylyltransferase
MPSISTSLLLEHIVKGYQGCDFDKKLKKMGRAELMAQGSNFNDRSTNDDIS